MAAGTHTPSRPRERAPRLRRLLEPGLERRRGALQLSRAAPSASPGCGEGQTTNSLPWRATRQARGARAARLPFPRGGRHLLPERGSPDTGALCPAPPGCSARARLGRESRPGKPPRHNGGRGGKHDIYFSFVRVWRCRVKGGRGGWFFGFFFGWFLWFCCFFLVCWGGWGGFTLVWCDFFV